MTEAGASHAVSAIPPPTAIPAAAASAAGERDKGAEMTSTSDRDSAEEPTTPAAPGSTVGPTSGTSTDAPGAPVATPGPADTEAPATTEPTAPAGARPATPGTSAKPATPGTPAPSAPAPTAGTAPAPAPTDTPAPAPAATPGTPTPTPAGEPAPTTPTGTRAASAHRASRPAPVPPAPEDPLPTSPAFSATGGSTGGTPTVPLPGGIGRPTSTSGTPLDAPLTAPGPASDSPAHGVPETGSEAGAPDPVRRTSVLTGPEARAAAITTAALPGATTPAPAPGTPAFGTPRGDGLPGTGPSDATIPPGSATATGPATATTPVTAPEAGTERRGRRTAEPLPAAPPVLVERRVGAWQHVAGVVVGLLLGAIGVWVTLFGQARVLGVQAPTWGGGFDPLGVVLVTAGVAVLAVVLWLGRWTPAVPLTAGAGATLIGLAFLYSPASMHSDVVSWVATESTQESVAQTVVAATSGTVFLIGALLLVSGLALARRGRTHRV